MKKSRILLASAFAVVLSVNLINTKSIAANNKEFNVAVVDVQKVVESSPATNALKTDRQNKLEDLDNFVKKARADVEKQTDAQKKKDLEDKYNKELNERKGALDKDYLKKLSEIDNGISFIIKSKTSKYDLVLTKSVVLNGGTDITPEIIKGLK